MPAGIHAPDLSSGFSPVGIASIDKTARADCKIIRLIHARLVGIHRHHAGLHVDSKHIVAGVVGNEHRTSRIEANTVADTSGWQFDEQGACAIWCNYANRALPDIVDHIQVPISVTGRAFNAIGEATRRCEPATNKQRALDHPSTRSSTGVVVAASYHT